MQGGRCEAFRMSHESSPIGRTDPLLNGDQVGEVLGCSTRTVRALAARGELSRVVLGNRSTRYRLSDVEAFIERRTVKAGGAAASD